MSKTYAEELMYERRANRDLFFTGMIWGFVGGVIVTIIVVGLALGVPYFFHG